MAKGFAIWLLVLVSSAPAIADDATVDFGVGSNPNGNWSYLSAGVLLSRGQSTCNGITGIECWDNDTAVINYASISKNTTGSPIPENGTVSLPPGELNLDPEDTGSVIVEWTAPSSGNYSVSGFFSGLDVQGNPHSAEVILGSSPTATVLFSTTIDTGDVYDFSFTEAMTAGEVLDFEVDSASPGTYLGTGFDATIDPAGVTPEPSSLGLFVLGLVVLALRRWRARIRRAAGCATI